MKKVCEIFYKLFIFFHKLNYIKNIIYFFIIKHKKVCEKNNDIFTNRKRFQIER